MTILRQNDVPFALRDTAKCVLKGVSEQRTQLETVFSDAADSMIGGQESLSRLMQALATYRSGLGTIAGGTIAVTIARIGDRIQQARDMNRVESDAIILMTQALEQAKPKLDELSRVVRMIECFANTARIVETDVHLSQDVAFSGEIRILAGQSRESYHNLRENHLTLEQQTGHIRDRQSAFESEHLSYTMALRERLAEHAELAGPEVSQAILRLERDMTILERASDHISSGLASLQFGDRLRQRLEHVETFLDPKFSAEADVSSSEILHRIGAAQLQSAGEDLSRQRASLRSELDCLADQTGAVIALAAELASADGLPLASRLSGLKTDSLAGLEMLRHGRAVREELEGAMLELTGTVNEMETVVEQLAEIQTRMRLASVNVLLRSVRAGDAGAAMQTVARQFSELSDQCAHHQSQIIQDLRNLTKIADDMKASHDHDVTDDLAAASDELALLEEVLLLAESWQSELETLAMEGPKAQAAFANCSKMMDTQSRTAERLFALGNTLAQTNFPIKGNDDGAIELARCLRLIYSTPEERAIHDRVCGTELTALEDTDWEQPLVFGKPVTVENSEIEWF
ncbi:hypothetical protein [Primorskyibacter sp. 2E233]|uniref:hypothetical protein n=1 Tax=Primorskyibacter sp. 2E233 TaxID=3413431 RepID=UPI003BF2972B